MDTNTGKEDNIPNDENFGDGGDLSSIMVEPDNDDINPINSQNH